MADRRNYRRDAKGRRITSSDRNRRIPQDRISVTARVGDNSPLGIINQLSNQFRNNLNHTEIESWLHDIAEYGSSENLPANWWNCSSCGFTSGLCISGNCCNGSYNMSNGNWSIDCKRRIKDPFATN